MCGCVNRRGFTGTRRFQRCANETAPLSSSHQHASCSTIKKEEQQGKRGDFSAEAAWTDAVEAEAPKRCGNNEALHPSLLSIEIEDYDCRVPVVIINYSALLCVWGASSDRVSTSRCWRQVKAICVSNNYNRSRKPTVAAPYLMNSRTVFRFHPYKQAPVIYLWDATLA